MFEKILKILYNNNSKKERVDNTMKPNLLSAQISVFMTDGIMNPNRYSEKVNQSFSKIFSIENMALNIPNAPDDMPLVQFSSDDNKYQYHFARKRLNFYLNFSENDNEQTFTEYLLNIYNFIQNELLPITRIARIGIAVNYYYDIVDNPPRYWIEKLKLPFSCNKSVDVLYTINNKIEKEKLTFNNILSFSNAILNSSKSVPSLSVDVNNEEVEELSKQQLEYIFNKLNLYKLEKIEESLKISENGEC